MTLPTKKLYRSNIDYKIAGVCGGIAEYLGIDSTIARLGWILLGFLGGSCIPGYFLIGGISAYLLAWVVIPKRPNIPPNLDEKAGAITNEGLQNII